MSLRIGFVGAVELSMVSLLTILESKEIKVEIIITLKDEIFVSKSGRVSFDEIAHKHSIPLLKVDNINDDHVYIALSSLKLDHLFVIGWSQLLSTKVYSTVKGKSFGIHPSKLPQGKGRAPIPWTIIKQLTDTAVSLFELNEQADDGDVYGQVELKVSLSETATELYEKVKVAHIKLLNAFLPKLITGQLQPIELDMSIASHWPIRRPSDGLLLQSQTVEESERLIRALTPPYPGAFIEINNKKVIVSAAKIAESNILHTNLSQIVGDVWLDEKSHSYYMKFSNGYLKLEQYSYDDLNNPRLEKIFTSTIC